MSTDPTTFEPEQLLKHVRWMRALAQELVDDVHAAEDLVQDTWAAALRSEPDTNRPLRPWLGRVLRDFFRQRARGAGRRRAREIAAFAADDELAPDQLLERAEAHALLADEVQHLTEPFRETVLLRYFEGLSAVEIANLRDVPSGTVRWRLKHGLDELRERLDARYDGDRTDWCRILAPIAGFNPSGHVPITSPPGTPTPISTTSLFSKVLLMTTAAKIVAVLMPLAVIALGVTYRSEIGFLVMSVEEQKAVAQYRPIEVAAPEIQSPNEASTSTSRSPVTPEFGTAVNAISSQVAEPELQSTSISARFLDTDGNPLGRLELHGTFGRTEATAFTSIDGEVALKLPPEQDSQVWRLEARGEGYASVQLFARVRPGDTTHLGDIQLNPGGTLSGVVLDTGGTPVANATIVALDAEIYPHIWEHRYQWSNGGFFTHEKQFARTNAKGEFQLRGIPVGAVRLGSRAEGMAAVLSSKIDVRASEEGFGLVITLAPLEPDQRIEGVVLSSNGSPLPHARLRIVSNHAQTSKYADANGRFCLAFRPEDEVQLSATSPEEPDSKATQAGLHPGDLDVVLQFPKRAPVELRVVDSTGAPVDRFALEVVDQLHNLTVANYSEDHHEAGRMQLDLPNEPRTLLILAPGFAEGRIEWNEALFELNVIEVSLDSTAPVSGVVTASGTPIAGTRITLIEGTDEGVVTNGFPVRFRDYLKVDEVISNAFGEFALTVREPGSFYIFADSEGYALSELGPISLSPETGHSDLNIALVRGGSIAGRVFGTKENGAVGAIVGISRGDGHAKTNRTGSDGFFRFEHLTPGPWQVQLVDEEFDGSFSSTGNGKPHLKIPSNCTVTNATETWFEIRTDAELDSSETPIVHGVLTIDGEPPVGWIAQLAATEEFGATDGDPVPIDSSGHFELRASSTGRKRISLRSRSMFIFDVLDLSIGDNPWSLNVETGALAGSVPTFDTSLKPDQYFFVRKGPNDLMCLAPIEPDANGEFDNAQVPTGPGYIARVQADAPSFDDAIPVRELTVGQSDNARVDL
ncbi:MAG: RNA polymerase sigma factor (sigma-70 family) [Planctomycetota bacterium]|jgi:RNA polymerase sigma factor (sigma-70 family)